MRDLLALAVLGAVAPVVAGFDLGSSRVPEDEMVSGGSPKDGIPAIVHPKLVPVSEAGFLHADDRVVGVVVGREARACPLRILNWRGRNDAPRREADRHHVLSPDGERDRVRS